MTTTTKTQCSNVTPMDTDIERMKSGDPNGLCPECGAYLHILSSGTFEQHDRRFPKKSKYEISEALKDYKDTWG